MDLSDYRHTTTDFISVFTYDDGAQSNLRHNRIRYALRIYVDVPTIRKMELYRLDQDGRYKLNETLNKDEHGSKS